MNEIVASLHARKSVRAYLKKPISKQDKQTILEAFCQRKYESDFAHEMTRSVARYLKDFEVTP